MRGSSKFFKPERKIATGKHTANPGFEKGNHWIECDRCGMDVRYKDSRKTWDGLVVCPADWEPRHEQDFVRVKPEDTAPKGDVRTNKDSNFLSVTYSSGEGGGIPDPTFGAPITPVAETSIFSDYINLIAGDKGGGSEVFGGSDGTGDVGVYGSISVVGDGTLPTGVTGVATLSTTAPPSNTFDVYLHPRTVADDVWTTINIYGTDDSLLASFDSADANAVVTSVPLDYKRWNIDTTYFFIASGQYKVRFS